MFLFWKPLKPLMINILYSGKFFFVISLARYLSILLIFSKKQISLFFYYIFHFIDILTLSFYFIFSISSVQLLSHVWLCDAMDRSRPGLPVHHQLPEFTQTHIRWVSDAIQPSHPLPSPSPALKSFPASGSFKMSQLFASGGQSIGVSASTSVNTQDWSPLGWTGWISLHSKGLSRVFSNTTVQKHQFFSTQLSL